MLVNKRLECALISVVMSEVVAFFLTPYYSVCQIWYPLSKTLAEKAAWEFAKEKGLDVVVVNPGTVMGPVLPPTLNASMLMLLHLLQGNIFKKL